MGPTFSANCLLSSPFNNTNYIHQSLLSSYSAPRTSMIVSFIPAPIRRRMHSYHPHFTGSEIAGISVTLPGHRARPKERVLVQHRSGLSRPTPAPAAAPATLRDSSFMSLTHCLPRPSGWKGFFGFLVNTKTELCDCRSPLRAHLKPLKAHTEACM